MCCYWVDNKVARKEQEKRQARKTKTREKKKQTIQYHTERHQAACAQCALLTSTAGVNGTICGVQD